jgi:hypothetical protein
MISCVMHGGAAASARPPRHPLDRDRPGRRLRQAAVVASAALLGLLATISPAHAQSEQGDPSKVGDLIGNLPIVVYLLIPLALALALLTAVVLGPLGERDVNAQRAGGVSRALSRRDTAASRPPP